MQERYDYTIPFGLALWEQYTIQSLKDARREQCVMISYQELMKDPVGQTERLYNRLRKQAVQDLRRPSTKVVEGVMEPIQGSVTDPDRLLREWGNQRQACLCNQFHREKL